MDALLEPISDASPTGVDLSYDPVYNDLAVLMEGTPENQFETGSAKDPDWPAVRKLAEESLKRSKDLQIAVYFTVALTRTAGMEGAARGLELIAGTVRKYWANLFPNLDPEDPDPTQRINILSQLTVDQGSFGDPIKFIERISVAPIFQVPGLAVTMALLKQESSGDGKGGARLGEIMAAADPSAVQAGGDALRRAVGAVHALDDFLIETLGRASSPSFDPLIKVLDRGVRLFDGLDPSAVTAGVDALLASEAPAGPSGPSVAARRTPAAGPAVAGEINSPEDVRRTIAKICEYYEANEPSSPVPLLLKRAERLVGKNFLDLIDNLTPSARSEFTVLMGPEADAS